jgi:hypothetical protein
MRMMLRNVRMRIISPICFNFLNLLVSSLVLVLPYLSTTTKEQSRSRVSESIERTKIQMTGTRGGDYVDTS